MAELKCV